MSNIFYEILMRFGSDMGIESTMSQSIAIIEGAMLLLAAASCFLGFRIFRAWCAVLAFFLTAIGLYQLLHAVAALSVIVVAFSIIGLIVAFLAYRWWRASAFLLVAVIAFGFINDLTGYFWLALVIALVPAILTIPISEHVIIFSTSIWGGLMLGSVGIAYLGRQLPVGLQIVFGLTLAAIGVFVQYLSNKIIRPTRKGESRPPESVQPLEYDASEDMPEEQT